MSDDLCEYCARPVAGDETDPDDVHCFRRFDPSSKEGSDFEVGCLRIAVARLRGEAEKLEARTIHVVNNHSGGDGPIRLLSSAERDPEADYRRKLRDKYAGQALQGILADASNGGVEHTNAQSRREVLFRAKQYAEEMLELLDYRRADQ